MLFLPNIHTFQMIEIIHDVPDFQHSDSYMIK